MSDISCCVCAKYEDEVSTTIKLKCKHIICIQCYTEHAINSVKELHSIRCPVCRDTIVKLEDMITVDLTNINGPLYNNDDIDFPDDPSDSDNEPAEINYKTEDVDYDCVGVDDDLIKTMRALGVSEEEIQASINKDISDQKKYLN
jgi:hypothetical protein